MNLIKWISVTDRYTKMYLDRLLEPLGLNSSQHMYIVRICQNPGITQDQFFKLFYIHPSNITRALTFLEKEGFLEKKTNPKDKRTCRLYPTEKAETACAQIKQICMDWNNRVLKGFREEEKQLFLDFLERAGKQAVFEVSNDWEKENQERERQNDDKRTADKP